MIKTKLTGLTELDLLNSLYSIKYVLEGFKEIGRENKEELQVLDSLVNKLGKCLTEDEPIILETLELAHLYSSLNCFKDALEIRGEELGYNSINNTLWTIFPNIMTNNSIKG